MTANTQLIKQPALEGEIYELRLGIGTDTCHIHLIGWRLALCGSPVASIPKPDDLVMPCNSCFYIFERSKHA